MTFKPTKFIEANTFQNRQTNFNILSTKEGK